MRVGSPYDPDPDQGRIWAHDPWLSGSARWAGAHHLHERGYGAYGRHTLGYLPATDRRSGAIPITYDGDRHEMIVAPTRGGKGVSGVNMRLMEHPGGVIVADGKSGELARMTARYRRDVLGQNVILIDAYDEVASDLGFTPARINTMSAIDLDGEEAFDEAMLQAASIVVPSGAADNHWDGEGEAAIAGFMLSEAELGGNLADVRAVLNRSRDGLHAYLHRMLESPYPLVQAAAGRLSNKEAKEVSGVLSTAQRNTHFLESEKLAYSLSANDFDPSEIGEDTSIYIINPGRRFVRNRSYYRLLIGFLLQRVAALPQKPSEPVLFVLEEMAALGRMEIIAQAFGLMAGYGLQILAVVQDFSQLRDLYRDRWQTFIANSASIQCFGTNDMFTAEYLSKLAGTTSVETLSYESAERRAGLFGDPHYRGASDVASPRLLITPDELRALPAHLQFIALAGSYPSLAYRPAYFLDRRFRDQRGRPLYDIHPNHAHLPIPRAYDFTRAGLDLDALLGQHLRVG